jgi:hypothetical protein
VRYEEQNALPRLAHRPLYTPPVFCSLREPVAGSFAGDGRATGSGSLPGSAAQASAAPREGTAATCASLCGAQSLSELCPVANDAPLLLRGHPPEGHRAASEVSLALGGHTAASKGSLAQAGPSVGPSRAASRVSLSLDGHLPASICYHNSPAAPEPQPQASMQLSLADACAPQQSVAAHPRSREQCSGSTSALALLPLAPPVAGFPALQPQTPPYAALLMYLRKTAARGTSPCVDPERLPSPPQPLSPVHVPMDPTAVGDLWHELWHSAPQRAHTRKPAVSLPYAPQQIFSDVLSGEAALRISQLLRPAPPPGGGAASLHDPEALFCNLLSQRFACTVAAEQSRAVEHGFPAAAAMHAPMEGSEALGLPWDNERIPLEGADVALTDSSWRGGRLSDAGAGRRRSAAAGMNSQWTSAAGIHVLRGSFAGLHVQQICSSTGSCDGLFATVNRVRAALSRYEVPTNAASDNGAVGAAPGASATFACS